MRAIFENRPPEIRRTVEWLCPGLQAGPVPGRRHPQMLLAITAEIRKGGEVHPFGNLCEGIPGVIQEFLENRDRMPVDIRHDGIAGEAFDRRGQIFLRNVQLTGIPAHAALRT